MSAGVIVSSNATNNFWFLIHSRELKYTDCLKKVYNVWKVISLFLKDSEEVKGSDEIIKNGNFLKHERYGMRHALLKPCILLSMDCVWLNYLL